MNHAGVIYNSKPSLSFPLFIPSEKSYISIDNTPGKDYITILFSNSPLDTKGIVETILDSPGNYYETLQRALGGELISYKDLRCVMNKIGFISLNQDKVVALTFEMKHQ